MYLVNFLDSISNSDIVFNVLMILLTLICVILFYLIYTQNEELTKKMKDKNSYKSSVAEDNIPSAVTEVESLERPSLVETTLMEIPDPLELTRSIYINPDTEELQTITKELESAPKERKIDMTAYEAEQEETAIISYDELLKQSGNAENRNDNNGINLRNTENEKNVDFEDEPKVDFDYQNGHGDRKVSYEHEEYFLNSLKKLQEMLEK